MAGTRSRWEHIVGSASLRRAASVAVIALVIEYFVVPTLAGASHRLGVLGRLSPGWLLAGTALEAASLVCYALLVQRLLLDSKIALFTQVRITLATTAVSHVIPAGAVGGAGLGYQQLTARGVTGTDAAFAMATSALGSAVVLNLLLLAALVCSIPLAGLHTIYVVIALVGLLALLGAYALAYLLTRGEDYAIRAVRAIGRWIPLVGADRLERVVRDLGDSVTRLAADRHLISSAALWAVLNWLLDAGALWAFLAAFGHLVNPVTLFAAYGIAYVLAAIPLTPAGLGVVEVTAATLLVSFGVPQTVATLAVLGWRLVNFWLPIPLGAVAYLSLHHRPGFPPPPDRRLAACPRPHGADPGLSGGSAPGDRALRHCDRGPLGSDRAHSLSVGAAPPRPGADELLSSPSTQVAERFVRAPDKHRAEQ